MYQEIKNTKRFVAAAMLLCLCAFGNKAMGQTWDISDYSSSGNNVTATLSIADSTLIISGSGNMADFDVSASGIPWNDYLTLIKTVVIDSGVTNIGNIAFQGCINLQWITIPEGVAIIGARAFDNCALLYAVAIPASVITIEDGAFSNCTGLVTIYDMATTPQNINNNVFDGLITNTIYLATQKESTLSYQSANIWQNFKCVAPYIVINDSIIKGMDGTVYYFDYQKNNSNLPKRLSIYDGATDTAKMIVDYNNEGLPKRFETANTTILVNGYNGNTCNATIVSSTGQVYSVDNIAFTSTLDATVHNFTNYSCDKLIGKIFDKCAEKYQLFSVPDMPTIYKFIDFGVEVFGLDKYMPNSVKMAWYCFSFAMSEASMVTSCGSAIVTLAGGPVAWVLGVPLIANCLWNVRSAYEASRKFGEVFPDLFNNNNSSWSLRGGTLIITDDNAFSSHTYPWKEKEEEIKKLIIENGVTFIPNYAFLDCTELKEAEIENGTNPISFGDNVFSISYYISFLKFYDPNASINTVYLGRDIGDFGAPFSDITSLKTLSIGNTVDTINENSFKKTGLTSVIIPSNVKSIGSNAFSGCTNLTTATLENGITTIGYGAFQNTGLTNITIPNSVMSVGSAAFNNCPNIQSVTIEEGTDTLNFEAGTSPNNFYGSSIGYLFLGRNIYFSQSWTDSPFENNALLTSLTIGNQVTSIPASCFSKCTGLANASIGSRVIEIGNSAFKNSGLTSITVPSNVKTIGNSAFSGCVNLASATLENGITTIGAGAFQNTGLTSISIPSSVVSVGTSAFNNCPNIQSVTIEEGTDTLNFEAGTTPNNFYGSSIGNLYLGRNIYFSQSWSNSPFENNTALTSLTIGNQVTSIPASCFSKCTGLTNASIGSGVTEIGSSAFQGCSTLQAVTIPNSVITIGRLAFNDCTNLKNVIIEDGLATLILPVSLKGDGHFQNSPVETLYLGRNIDKGGFRDGSPFEKNLSLKTVTIGNNVTAINDNSFQNCTGLTNASIGSDVTSIGSSAFSGCGLTEIHSENLTPPNATINCFHNVYNTCTLYVPDEESVNKYQKAPEWQKFYTIKTGIEKVLTSQFTFFPNPVESDLYIKSDLPIERVEICSLAGTLIMQEKNVSEKISVAALPKGVYLLKVYTGKGVAVSKVMKE